MKRRLTAVIILCSMLWAAGTIVNARSVDVVLNDKSVRVDASRRNGVAYVDLAGLLDVFGARVDWDPHAQRLRADLDGRIWVFWGSSALVSIDGEVGGLGDPVITTEHGLAAPVAPLASLLTQFSGMTAQLDEHTLYISHRELVLSDYTVEERKNGTLIDLRLSGSAPWESFVSEGNWINLTLHRTKVDPSRLNRKRPHALVREVRAVQFDSSAQVSFRMREPFEKYVVSRGESPGRLTILVGEDDLSNEWTSSPPPLLLVNQGGEIDRIVIDPGHGGSDHGARSLDGVISEKDVALVIAERTAKLLDRDQRFEVFLTRSEDSDVATSERMRQANVSGADLFVSIHTTAFESDAGRGCQTFFYGQPLDDRSRLVTAEVNGTLQSDGVGSEDHLGTTDEQESYAMTHRPASAELARLIQDGLESSLPIPSRGVSEGSFDILDGIDMPGVVVCLGSVANPRDEDHLRRRSFQKDVAEAIYDAIVSYRKRVSAGRVSISE